MVIDALFMFIGISYKLLDMLNEAVLISSAGSRFGSGNILTCFTIFSCKLFWARVYINLIGNDTSTASYAILGFKTRVYICQK